MTHVACKSKLHSVVRCFYLSNRQTYLIVNNATEVLVSGGADHTQYVVELIQVVLAGEDGPIGQHLRQYTTHRPYIDWDTC